MISPWTSLRARASAAVNQRLRTLAGGRWAGRCRPETVLVLLTERCNARCLHCDIWKNRGKEDRPSLDEWKTALGDLRRWLGRAHVVFTGGEALLVPFAPEVVAHAARLGLLVEHLTHGYWPDQARVERLARANPWRITLSCDGLGTTHDAVRGREGFFETLETTLETLLRLRRDDALTYRIRLKTVIMEHNLDDVGEVAGFAKAKGIDEVFYQPIEQNYNAPDDPSWFEHSRNWPTDPERAVSAVLDLIDRKRRGEPVANSSRQLEVMIPYFRDPGSLLVVTQSHIAHKPPVCSAVTDLQIQANGDVKTCWCMPAVGNLRTTPLRTIWEGRPRWWESGCCMARRMSAAEKAAVGLDARAVDEATPKDGDLLDRRIDPAGLSHGMVSRRVVG